MRTLDLIKLWLAKPAFCTLSAPCNYHAADATLTNGVGIGHCDKQLSRPLLSSDRQADQGTTSKRVVSIQTALSHPLAGHPLSADKATPSPEQTAAEIHEAIIKLLYPVDWASLQTLSRYIGLSHKSTTHHLRELEEQGKVGIGQRIVPPETRTVAWLTDSGRLSRSGDVCHLISNVENRDQEARRSP